MRPAERGAASECERYAHFVTRPNSNPLILRRRLSEGEGSVSKDPSRHHFDKLSGSSG